MLASAITDIDVPREALATLFSRDPKIAKVIARVATSTRSSGHWLPQAGRECAELP